MSHESGSEQERLFFSGTANPHNAAPTGSRGLQGLSLVRWVGVTDLEVTHSVQTTVLESICHTTLTQSLNVSPLLPALFTETRICRSSGELLWMTVTEDEGRHIYQLLRQANNMWIFLSTNSHYTDIILSCYLLHLPRNLVWIFIVPRGGVL